MTSGFRKGDNRNCTMKNKKAIARLSVA